MGRRQEIEIEKKREEPPTPKPELPSPPAAPATPPAEKVPTKQCVDAFFHAFKARHGSPYPVDKKDAAQTKRLLTWLQGQGMDAKAEFSAHLGEFFDDDWVVEQKAATLAYYCSWFKKALQKGRAKSPALFADDETVPIIANADEIMAGRADKERRDAEAKARFRAELEARK